MKYDNIIRATFIERPNRFIAKCLINNDVTTVHVKNTGRCKELLTPNVGVYLQHSDNKSRKTEYDLVAVEKDNRVINIDSQCPNKVAAEWLTDGGFLPSPTVVRPEVKYGNSRLDFYLENESDKAFVEVKGVTLKVGEKAIFPDAPTERGRRHLEELMSAVKDGYKCAVLFMVTMEGCNVFMPNDVTDKPFADKLRQAAVSGVNIIAVDCTVTPDSVTYSKEIEVRL